jgi:hypothetical protein
MQSSVELKLLSRDTAEGHARLPDMPKVALD